MATFLADMFDMRFFDMYDMFNFDNSPNTLTDVLKINGSDYVDKQMRGIMKSEFDFSGVVFVVDTKIISICKDLFEDIRKGNIVIFLRRDFKTEFYQREHFLFRSPEEKEYYSLKIDELFEIEQEIAYELAHLVLDIDDISYRQLRDIILEDLKKLLK